MSKQSTIILRIIVRLLSLALILTAAFFTDNQYQNYLARRTVYPHGSRIAGLPVGGLEMGAAIDRLKAAYLNVPVELQVQGTIIHVDPTDLGFTLDLASMVSTAEVMRTQTPFWNGFLDFLLNHPRPAFNIPLASTVSEERIRAYLKEQIAPRYAAPAVPSAPILGSIDFTKAQPGSELDLEPAIPQIASALRSVDTRIVTISSRSAQPPRPSIDSLHNLIEQTIQGMGYNGTLELYMSSPATGEKLSLAYDQGKPVPPNIVFTAASTMKIPIMVSVFRRQPDPLPADIADMFTAMIEFSDNDMSDKLTQTLEKNLGPLLLTKDLQTLGFKNSFLAGYFYSGSPLLQRFSTPANQRTDIATAPDAYNQTTPADMGVLLEDIYTCAEHDTGPLEAAFPGQITQSKCKQMLEFLSKNRNGVLLEAGLPETTRVAHKHGWTTESDGLIHTISDAGIVFSPGSDYILTIYIHDRDQLLWERMNFMIALLSESVYNFYNLP